MRTKSTKYMIASLVGIVVSVSLMVFVHTMFSILVPLSLHASLYFITRSRNELMKRYRDAVQDSSLSQESKDSVLFNTDDKKLEWSDYLLLSVCYSAAIVSTYVHLVYVQ